MVRPSNNLIGILNIATFILSIPILWTGLWLNQTASSDCDRFLTKPLIAVGAFLLLVSVAGVVGACCRVTWLMWVYLLFTFLLIVLLLCFTVFAFVVTNHGAGEALSGKGYKEYRLGDYSNWMKTRVSRTKNWRKIRSCLVESEVCSDFNVKYHDDTVERFLSENLSALQSGCCKPSNDCNFTYVGPTNWTKPAGKSYTNLDCNAWDNNLNTLCFDCESCKAGLIESIKSDWKKVAIVNVVFLVFLIIVYSIGCCAFRNNRQDNSWKRSHYKNIS